MKNILIISVFCLSVNVLALDSAQQNGLKQAQQLLKSPSERAAVIKSDPNARAADVQAAITVMGSKEDKNELYDVSGDLLEWVVSQGVDPAQLMEKYKKNPVQFFNDIPEQQRQRIKALAESIEQRRRPVRNPAGATNP